MGGTTSVKIDVRVIAATNRDLKKAIQEAKFREDLFYRLNVIVVEMPPLREREGDMAVLVKYFLDRMKTKKATRFEGITEQALQIMRQYRWPGNVRELENVIERIVTLNDDVAIKPEHLPAEMTGNHPAGYSSGSPLVLPQVGVLKSGEKDLILRVLQESHFNKKQAASRLGISRPTLYEKIRKYGIGVK